MCKQNTAIIWVHVQSPLVTVHTITMSKMTAFYMSIDSYYKNTITHQRSMPYLLAVGKQLGRTRLQQLHLTHNDSTVHD